SATKIKTVVPTAASSGTLAVSTPDGTGTSVALFKVTPRVTGFSPSSGLRGSSVEIDGTTFTGASAVKFGSVAATTFSVDTDSKITATVPLTATTNKISVTTPAGTSTSVASYTVILPPTISGFSPASGVAGTVVTMSGSNLAGPTGGRFTGVAASTVTPVSATQLKATVPPGATTGKIAVATIAGTAQSSGSFTVPLAITSFSPNFGVVGSNVVIQGAGFSKVTGVTLGNLAAGGSIDSDSQITAVVPTEAQKGRIPVNNRLNSPTGTSDLHVTLRMEIDLGNLGAPACSYSSYGGT